MASDPFAVLGLASDASADDVQAARRELARAHHPDVGGDASWMRTINEAADAALRLIERGAADAGSAVVDGSSEDATIEEPRSGTARDVPSFVVEALPVETFEALLVAASMLGQVLDDEPPYRLDVVLDEPIAGWCRLEIVPDAGSSTVSLTVAGIHDAPTPDVIAVRDAWIATLNTLDWP